LPGLVDRIAAEVGPPEVLVDTVGTYHLGEALDATPEDLRLMIDVNFRRVRVGVSGAVGRYDGAADRRGGVTDEGDDDLGDRLR
jgi:NAD(P)-dependent dehydrogenase (short-subunit alcohol dehydrogenase family)